MKKLSWCRGSIKLLMLLNKEEDAELEVLMLVMTVASDTTSVLVKDATEDDVAADVGVGARTTKVEADVVLVVVVKEDHCSALLAVDVDGRGGKVDKTGDAKEELVVLTEEEAIEEDNDPKRARGDGLVAVVVVGVYV